MFCFVFIFLFFNFSKSINKIDNITFTISVWSGKEQIQKLLAQAKTWFKSFDEILIFSDIFWPGTCRRIQKAAYPTKVQCISLGSDLAKHLEGSEFDHPWFYAQNRFLPAMKKTYDMFSNASFFIFCDDDTYILKEPLYEEMKTVILNQPRGIGRSYCSWDKIATDMVPQRSFCHPFLQGGAGVVLNNKLMEGIEGQLLNCSERFNDAEFAGSMRFAICAERVFGINNWSDGGYFDCNTRFHSDPPSKEIPLEGLEDQLPVTFHKLTTSDFYTTFQSQFAIFTYQKKKYMIDMYEILYKHFIIPLYKNNYKACYVPGLRLIVPFLGIMHDKDVKWKVLFSTARSNKGKVIGVDQVFGKITIRLLFDDDIKSGVIIPFNIQGKNGIFIYKMKTPNHIKCIS